MSKLLEKIRKNTVVNAEILKNSKYFDSVPKITTRVPFLNVALSGSFDGGLPGGIIQIAAPPKHFKTNFMLELMHAYQEDKKKEDYIIVLYDTELGSTPDYYEKCGIDTSRVDHRPIKSVEELKNDIANLLNDIDEGDNVLIAIDSLGMLRSNKETEDAIKGDDKTDMTRAKAIKSLFRIITMESAMKQIPIIVVNHSYQTLELYSKEVAAGGRGAQYAAHTLFFISKAQEKEGDELAGFRFTLKAALSRYVKENSTFPIIVKFGHGIEKYSGVFDLAEELGFIKPYVAPEDKEEVDEKGKKKKKEKVPRNAYDWKGSPLKRDDMENNPAIMDELLANKEFVKAVEKKYAL